MNSIGILGRGFVGTAVFEGMKHAFDVFSWDKAKGWLVHEQKTSEEGPISFDRVCKERGISQYKCLIEITDGPIFVCVPTPMRKDGSCDTSIVEGVINELNDVCGEMKTEKVVVIKSTIPPGTTDRLDRSHQHLHICFNPEFLRERNFVEDFKNQDRIVIGGTRQATNVVKQVYQTAYPDVPVTKTSDVIAELVKYTTNCFLATKVAVANEIKSVCDRLDVDYDKVVEYATKDKRLGTSHWSVPGPDGHLGFGGSCFVKDLNAFIALANDLDSPINTMNGAWDTNLDVRPERDWEELKGRAVSEEE